MTPVLSPQARAHWLDEAIGFVRRIGLQVTVAPADSLWPEAFLPEIRIRGGALEVMADAFPGDVLHEAAHVAILPPAFRPLADAALEAVTEAARVYCDAHADALMAHPEDPVCRALLQCSDAEATAWQYAAAQQIGMPDCWLFPPGSYSGQRDAILKMLKLKRYLGINGLQAAGWTLASPNPHRAAPLYPKMAFWLHPGRALTNQAFRRRA